MMATSKLFPLLVHALLLSTSSAQTWLYPILDVIKSVEMEDDAVLPNKVRFNVTVFHLNLTDSVAVNADLKDGNPDFGVFWGNDFVGPSIGDPNFKIIENSVMEWTYNNFTNNEVMFLSYVAEPAKVTNSEGDRYYIPAGVNNYNATVTYRPTVDNLTNPEPTMTISGPCCVNVEEEEISSVFLDYGFTVLALVCGFIVGAAIVILVLFIITKVRRKAPFAEQVYPYNDIEKSSANNTKSGVKYGGGDYSMRAMLLDVKIAFASAYDKCNGVLSKFADGSIVALLTIQDKLKMVRKMDDEDIRQTMKIEQDLEQERCNAMINATSMLVDGLRKNGDLDKGTADKCGAEMERKIKEMDKNGDQAFRKELETLLKSLSSKHRGKLEQLQEKQEEDVIKTRAQSSNLSPVEQREVMDLLEKEHNTESEELLYNLKLEQDEATERKRTESVIQRRMKIKEIQQEYIHDVESQGKLSPEQLDWLMQEHFKQQSAIDKLYDDEKARARMVLELKMAKRRALAEKHEMDEENESDTLNTIAMQSLSMVQNSRKGGILSQSEAKAMSKEIQQQMLAIKEKMEEDRAKQQEELNKKLSERKKQRLEALAKKQQQDFTELEKKHSTQRADAACDPMNLVEVKQTMLSHHRSEKVNLESEIDAEHAEELSQLSIKLAYKIKEDLLVEKERLVSRLQGQGLSEAKIKKLIQKHNEELENLETTQAEEKAKQMKHFNKKLNQRRNEWAQRRQEEQSEQDHLREHEENVVRKLMDNQVSLSEEERNRILKEHEIQMVQLDNGLALSKIQQKKLLEEKLAKKRATQMEKLQKKQNIEMRKHKQSSDPESEEDEHEAELNLMRKQAEDRLKVLTGENIEVENELAHIQDAMVQERANALKEQEVKLATMIAQLQMEKASEMTKIEEQEKAIHQLKANLMDDLNDKGVLSNPECQRVIREHQEEQEKLQERIDSQRARQEKQLKLRLQERLQQKEGQMARIQEEELRNAGSGMSTGAKLRRAAIMSKQMLDIEKFRNRMEKEISQTLEELKRQNEIRKKNAIQEQELQFLNGLLRLGKFNQDELYNVIHMLLPTKSEAEIMALMDQLLQGYRPPSQADNEHGKTFEGNTTLEERVLATTLSQIDDETLNESMNASMQRKTSKKLKMHNSSLPPLRRSSNRPDPVGRLSPDGYNSDQEHFYMGGTSKLPPLERKPKKKVSRIRRNSADDNYSY